MDRTAAAAYIRAMNLSTRLFTYFKGLAVGSDATGNRYFQEKVGRPGVRRRRWVRYAPGLDASSVPPEWYGWLHYTVDTPTPTMAKRPWQKPHTPNLTGTPAGYPPPAHDSAGGQRAATSGDYEAWTPDS